MTALDVFLRIAEQYVNLWQSEAEQEGYTRAEAVDEAAILEGKPNTANWEADRIPGTYYYVFVDGRYLYSDLEQAPIGDWKTLPVLEQLAAELAQEWGAGSCTPTGGNPDYGGAHVFALDKHGPWMTQSPAEAALKAKVTGAAEHPGPGGILVERIGEGRVGYLDALFAELAANGWEPNEVSEDGQRSPGNR